MLTIKLACGNVRRSVRGVLHTLADAYFNNYDSIVVTDATMTFLCGTQEGALEHCEKCYGSVLVTVDELEAALSA